MQIGRKEKNEKLKLKKKSLHKSFALPWLMNQELQKLQLLSPTPLKWNWVSFVTPVNFFYPQKTELLALGFVYFNFSLTCSASSMKIKAQNIS